MLFNSVEFIFGFLPVTALLSERLKLDEINEGFDRLAGAHTVRQIITP